MKKTLLLVTCLCFVSVSFAQLKVFSDGHISACSTSNQANSPISINCPGDTSYLITAKVDNKRGLLYEVTNSGNNMLYVGYLKGNAATSSYTNKSVIGMRADANGSGATNTNRAYGIMGCSNSGAYSIGVYGKAGSSYGRGAAIFGTTSDNYGAAIPNGEVYAGFFHGNVMITGNLTLSGSMHGLLLGESSNTLLEGSEEQDLERSMLSVPEKMAGLQTTVFHKSVPSIYNTKGVSSELGEEEPLQPNHIENQYYEKKHYALSAEKLETVFPELVYELKDGTKSINYIEMIPLLVQTINDLQCRLATLEKGDVPMARNLNNGTSSVDSSAPAVVAKLTQNKPNPFSERTTIRFTLPENAHNAFIYVFDMTGKMQKQIPVDSSMQSITINGYELSAGMYICSLVVNGKEMDTKRMILSK